MYVYIKSEPSLWTVGFYDPQSKWQSDSDHGSPEEAAKRVHYLNGGNIEDQNGDSALHQAIIEEIEYMIEDSIFDDYFEKEQAEKIETIFKEHKTEIVEKIIETLSFCEDIVDVFEEYFNNPECFNVALET